ncbi:MAG: Phosphoglycerol transferase I [Stenotrophomonas maltophilia]|uniref:Phosphoglycerol transferase I n=1 Tax=Stenotrophomonas maltophilia TaxID=40324 RepID=A0A7V8FGQ9_STEMA|nr:MAG: Phosphoglycerol transferase I [Stenotrophomonas maltophilia]
MWLVAIAVSPLARDGQRLYQQLRPVDFSRVAPEYKVPTQALQRPRNIVWIYGESLERTYLDERTFPGLMPNLNRLAGQALDVRGLASAEGSGLTIAGLVAPMCGVPLTTSQSDENSMDRMASFLPKAVCLGDYLKQQGYTNHYLGGADGRFAGKGQFLASHGFDEVQDLAWFKQQKKIGRAHYSPWGVHDDVLLDTAYQRFEQLSLSGEPFMLTTLTMDTHHPAGHLPVACKGQRYQSRYGNINMLNALKCSDRLISQLVERIQASPYGKDTLIVIASDHLAIANDLSHILAKQNRENLLLFIGEGVEPRQLQARDASTLDSGATLLSLLDPRQQAIGFGRLLLAEQRPASASAAAQREGGKDYPQYLAFARSLWLGEPTRELKSDADDQVVVGLQHVQPPVLLEYDKDWGLKSVYLENTSRQFNDADPDNTLAYVDRYTAFKDGSTDGDWCALLVNRDNGIKLYRDGDLRGGIAVDAPLDAFQGPRPSVRQAHMITQKGRRTHAGQYMLKLVASTRPERGFWIEAVSSQRKVVLAQQWVQPDANGRINVSFGLDYEVDDLEIRAWLNHAEKLAVDTFALVPSRARPRGKGYSAGLRPAPAEASSRRHSHCDSNSNSLHSVGWRGGFGCGGRREYVHVGSVAPSMALTPPQPNPSRLRQLSAICWTCSWGQIRFPQENGSDPTLFGYLTDLIHAWRGSTKAAGICRGGAVWVGRTAGAMDGAYEPPWMGLRRPRKPTVPRHPTECPLLLLLLPSTLLWLRQVQGAALHTPPTYSGGVSRTRWMSVGVDSGIPRSARMPSRLKYRSLRVAYTCRGLET